LTRLVKMVTGKPVNRFPTGYWFPNVSPVIEFIGRRGSTTQAMPMAEFSLTVTWAHSCECISIHFSFHSVYGHQDKNWLCDAPYVF